MAALGTNKTKLGWINGVYIPVLLNIWCVAKTGAAAELGGNGRRNFRRHVGKG